MRKLLALALLFGIVGLASAGTPTVQKYDTGSVVQTWSTSSADAADIDAAAVTSLSSGRVFSTKECPSVTVGGGFSSSGANSVIWIIRGTINDQTGVFTPSPIVTSATLTADTTNKVNGLFVASAAKFDTAGFNACVVAIKSISAGSVTLSACRH